MIILTVKDGWSESGEYRVYVENGKVTIRETYTELIFDGIDYLLRETVVPEREEDDGDIVQLLWPYNLFRAIAADSDRYGDLEHGGKRWEWLYRHGQVDWILEQTLEDAKRINKSARLKREWLKRLETEGDTCNNNCDDCMVMAFFGECVVKAANA